MKATKKLLALVLVVCMLIGMPLSINVSAFGTSDDDAPAVKAFVMPDHVAAATGLTADTGIMLAFNKNVNISNVSVGVGIVRKDTGAAYWDYEYGKASIQLATLTKLHNTYMVTLKSGLPVTTISGLVDIYNNLATVKDKADQTASGLKVEDYEFVVRLFDGTAITAEQQKNGNIDGLTYGTTAWTGTTKDQEYCQSNANIGSAANSVYDYIDIPITLEEDTLTLDSAQWVSESKLKITFSQEAANRGSNWCGVAIVDANTGAGLRYHPGNEGNLYSTDSGNGAAVDDWLQSYGYPSSTKATEHTITLVQTAGYAVGHWPAGSLKTMSWFKTHLEAALAEDEGANYKLVYVVQENAAGAIDARGETTGNYFISSVYGTDYNPLLVTHRGQNRAIVETTEALDVLTLDNITVGKFNGNWSELTLKFSEPVRLNTSNAYWYGLCVLQDGEMKYALRNASWSRLPGQNDGTTYLDTWQLSMYDPNNTYTGANVISDFIAGEYTAERRLQGARLCFYIWDSVTTKPDGVIESVYTEAGEKLSCNTGLMTPARETYLVDVDDLFYLTPTATITEDNTISVTTSGLSGIGGLQNHVFLRAYNANGEILSLNGANAEWPVTNGYNGTVTKMESGTAIHFMGMIQPACGLSNYSEIVAALNDQYGEENYVLELVVKDNTAATLGNNRCDNMVGYPDTYRYLRANAKYSNSTEDVGVIPFVDETANTVDVESVNVYDGGTDQKKVIITFTHDIDIDKFLENMLPNENGEPDSAKSVLLTLSAAGINNYAAQDGTIGTWYDQANVSNLARYGNSNNKLVGTVGIENDYAPMMEKLATLQDTYQTYDYAIRLRIEMNTGYATGNGFPTNSYIDPIDEGVNSPYMHTGTTYGQIWTDVNIIEAGSNVISVDGELYTDIMTGINAAADGSELILLTDATLSDAVTLPTSATLDLNGKTLTLGENQVLNARDAYILDNSDGNGNLVVESDPLVALTINAANSQFPLYDGQGTYKFFNYSFTEKGVKVDVEPYTNKYGVHLHFDNKAAYQLMADHGSASEIEIVMQIKLNGTLIKDYVFTDEGVLKPYGQACVDAADATELAKQTIVLTVSGLDALAETDELTVTAQLRFRNNQTIFQSPAVETPYTA